MAPDKASKWFDDQMRAVYADMKKDGRMRRMFCPVPITPADRVIDIPEGSVVIVNDRTGEIRTVGVGQIRFRSPKFVAGLEGVCGY